MPKLDNYRRYRYTADLWNHTTGPGATTPAGYFFVRQISFDVSQGTFGKLTVVLRDEDSDVMVGARLRNLIDGVGNEIFTDGIWVLDGVLPIVNVFGRREGFRANAQLTFIEGS